MSWLHGISARSLRHLDRVEIDLRSDTERGRHLVLVGPNGCGKSLLLNEIASELEAALEGRAHPAAAVVDRGDTERLDRDVRLAHLGRPVRLHWARPDRELRDAFGASRLMLACLPDPRETSVLPSLSTTPTDTDPKRPRERVGGRLSSLLTNRKAEERVARESGDIARAKVHEAWFLRVQSALRRLLHRPELTLAHDRDGFHLDLPDGRRMHLEELSRGHAAAIAIWAELTMRVEAARLRNQDPMLDPPGVAVIDALETNLDVRLQRELLPALAELHPGLQLVVATCSPLAAISLNDSIVFDLVGRRAVLGEELRRGGMEGVVASMLGVPNPRARSVRPPPPGSIPPPSAPVSRTAPPPGRLPPTAPRRTREGHGPWGSGEE